MLSLACSCSGSASTINQNIMIGDTFSFPLLCCAAFFNGVKPNSPGLPADPTKGLPATSLSEGPINYHSHPSGTKRMTLPGGGGATATWNQPPSGQDIKSSRGIEYVFAMKEQNIYIYNRTGVIAIFSLISAILSLLNEDRRKQ
jgi:hypothetical protein